MSSYTCMSGQASSIRQRALRNRGSSRLPIPGLLIAEAFCSAGNFYSGTDVADFADTLAGTHDLERQVMSKWNLSQVQLALRELPEKQRRTLELFFFEGVELKDIAHHIGETPENVRHYYYRGLHKLRKNGLVRILKGKETE